MTRRQLVSLLVLGFLALILPLSAFMIQYQTRLSSKAFVSPPPFVLPTPIRVSFGQAAKFNNPNSALSYIMTPASFGLSYQNPGTAELWFRYFKYQSNPYGPAPLYGRIETPPDGPTYDSLAFTDGPSAVYIIPDGTGCAGMTRLQEGVWYHLAGVVKGEVTKLYLNGRLECQQAWAPASILTPLGLLIGRTLGIGAGQYGFYGEIDEMRFSNIARYFVDFTPPSAPFNPDINTRLLYRFDGDVNDSSGNGNNGQIFGDVYFVTSTVPLFPSPIPRPTATSAPRPTPRIDSHTECRQKTGFGIQCVSVPGPGVNQCRTNSDCLRPPIPRE